MAKLRCDEHGDLYISGFFKTHEYGGTKFILGDYYKDGGTSGEFSISIDKSNFVSIEVYTDSLHLFAKDPYSYLTLADNFPETSREIENLLIDIGLEPLRVGMTRELFDEDAPDN